MATEKVKIAELTPIQTRAETDAATVAEYAEAMESKAKFPPVTVFADADTNTLWLADGIHRVEAAKAQGFKAVRADVKPGTRTEALRFALLANVTHGKAANTQADKRRRLELAWENRRDMWPREDGADPSAAVLAEACGVSLRTVKSFMATIQPTQIAQVEPPKKPGAKLPVRKAPPPPPPVRKVFGVDGKTREVPAAPVRPVAPARPAQPTPAPAPVRHEAPQRPVAPAPQKSYDFAKGVMTDRFGVVIPLPLRDAFKQETARDAMEQHLHQAVLLLKKGLEAKDPAFAQFRQMDLVELENVHRTAKFTKPYCVCRICQGNGRGSCTACHETGFQTEEQYERNPREFKA